MRNFWGNSLVSGSSGVRFATQDVAVACQDSMGLVSGSSGVRFATSEGPPRQIRA